MPLTLRFWGTRGSIATPGAHTVRYGGNTPCVELRTPEGDLVIFDAGTGIRLLGDALTASPPPVRQAVTADLFLSHPHGDHVQGLPFFAPLFAPGTQVTIWTTPPLASRVAAAVRQQMASEVFPIPFDRIARAVRFATLDGVHRGRGYAISACDVAHPGGAAAYRVCDAAGRAVVYVADNELGGAEPSGSDRRAALLEFARGSDVLIHDATFTPAEYTSRRGWGHSADEAAVALALEADVATLVLFHHAPHRSDAEVDARLAACRALARRSGSHLRVEAAAEGRTLRVGDDSPAVPAE